MQGTLTSCSRGSLSCQHVPCRDSTIVFITAKTCNVPGLTPEKTCELHCTFTQLVTNSDTILDFILEKTRDLSFQDPRKTLDLP